MKPVSRRTLLKQAGMLGAASLSSSLVGNVWADPLNWAPGIQLFTVAAELSADVPGTLQAIRKIGYRYVETNGFAKLSAKDFRKQLDEAGLSCPSAQVKFSGDDPTPLFDDVHAVGAHFAVSIFLVAKPLSKSVSETIQALYSLTLDDFKKTAELANQIGEKAKRAGLQYAYHNHNFEFREQGQGQTGYDVLVHETDPELVKFELDCGWMIVSGHNPVDYFKKYPNRYRLIHVKDFLPNGGPTTELMGSNRPKGTEFGRGHIDYKPIFAAAGATGIEYYFSEQEPPIEGMTTIEAAKASYNYMMAL